MNILFAIGRLSVTITRDDTSGKWMNVAWVNNEPRPYQFDLVGTPISILIPVGSGTFPIPPGRHPLELFRLDPRPGGGTRQVRIAPLYRLGGI